MDGRAERIVLVRYGLMPGWCWRRFLAESSIAVPGRWPGATTASPSRCAAASVDTLLGRSATVTLTSKSLEFAERAL
jgi:hypothetical protein